MARTEIPLVVNDSSGDPKAGATVLVEIRGSGGTAATVYATESTSTTVANPLTTNTSGRIDGWLEEGQYVLTVSGPGITTYSQAWDSKSGGPITKAGDTLTGNTGPANEAAIKLNDITLYRDSAASATLNGRLVVTGEARVGTARLVGTATSLALQDSTGAAIVTNRLATSFADNASIVRTDVGASGGIISGAAGAVLARYGIAATGVTVHNGTAATTPAPIANSFTINYGGGRDTLNLPSTAADTGITIGGDVELYRSAANVLSTPDTVNVGALQQGGAAFASTHLSDTANIGRLNATSTYTGATTFTGGLSATRASGSNALDARVTGDANPRVAITSDGVLRFSAGATAWDVNLSRGAADILHTDDAFRAVGTLMAGHGTAAASGIGALGPASEAALTLGADVVVYRSAANIARTADSFYSDAELRAGNGGAGQVRIGAIGPGSAAALLFPTSNLYQSAANTLKTDQNFIIAGNLTVTGTTTQQATQTSTGNLTAAQGDTGQVRVGNVGGNPTVFWGTAEDSSIYRDAADSLRTSDAFRVDGVLTTAAITSSDLHTINRPLATDYAVATQVAGVNRARITAAGNIEWHDATGVSDTTLSRSGVGILTLTGILNSTLGYRINGTALASTHLTDSAGLARLTGATFTGAISSTTVTATTSFIAPLGAVGTPSFTFSGDANTGVFSPGADSIALVTAGASRLSIDNAGAVTIGGTVTVGGQAVVVNNDTRLTNARTPTGTAGGHLTGTYPNPSVANVNAGIITDAHIAAGAAIADTKLATIATAGKIALTALPGIASTNLTDSATLARLGSAANFTRLDVIDAASSAIFTLQNSNASADLKKLRFRTFGGTSYIEALYDNESIKKTFLTFNHTTGDIVFPTGGISTAALADLGVTTAKLADLGVTTGKLANNAVTAAKVAADVATQAELDALSASAVRDGDAAGGVLSGTYPNPGFAQDMATQAELDSEATTRSGTDTSLQNQINAMRMVRGQVSSTNAGASGVAPVRGSGFTSGKIGTGQYRVTYSSAFATTPVVVITPISAVLTTVEITTESTTSFSYETRTLDGFHIDRNVNFIALAT